MLNNNKRRRPLTSVLLCAYILICIIPIYKIQIKKHILWYIYIYKRIDKQKFNIRSNIHTHAHIWKRKHTTMSFLASITNNSSLQSNLKATVTNTKRLSLQKFMNSEPTADLDAKLTDYFFWSWCGKMVWKIKRLHIWKWFR